MISCSLGVAQFVLIDIVTDFARLHPKVLIEQRVTNSMIDLITEGVDIAIRGHSGELPDSSLIQRFIANVEWQFYCSPGYLEQLEQLEQLQTTYDLASCRFLKVGRAGAKEAIPLQHKGGLQTHQNTHIALCSEDMSTIRQAAMMARALLHCLIMSAEHPLKLGSSFGYCQTGYPSTQASVC